MKPITRDELLGGTLASGDLVTVDIPEWDRVIHVGVMSGVERDSYEMAMLGQKKAADAAPGRPIAYNVRGLLVTFCARTPTGERLLHAGDVDAIGALSARTLDRIYSAAVTLNAMDEDSAEDVAKN